MLTNFGSVIQENELLHFIIWSYTVIFTIITTSTVDLPVNNNISCLLQRQPSNQRMLLFVFLFVFYDFVSCRHSLCLSQHVHFCILVLSSDQSGGSPEKPIPFGERKQGRQQVFPYFVVKAWHSLPSSVRHGSSSTKRVCL